MTATITIHYPEPDVKKLKLTDLNTAVVYGTVITAQGEPVSFLTAELKTKTNTYPGFSLPCVGYPFVWAFFFQDLDPDVTTVYTLTVKGKGAYDANMDNITRDPPPKYNLSVTSPLANAIVCSTFMAYGTSDESYTVTGTMGNTSTNTPYNGTPLQGPPNNQTWVFQFSNLPVGTNCYTFGVTDTGGNVNTNSTHVSVKSC